MKLLESISIKLNGGSFDNTIMLNQPFSINRLEIPTPFLVIATADSQGYCVVTHTEFETSTFIKVCEKVKYFDCTTNIYHLKYIRFRRLAIRNNSSFFRFVILPKIIRKFAQIFVLVIQ